MDQSLSNFTELNPPSFSADTLDQWSRHDGPPNGVTYADFPGGVAITDDENFGDCFEFTVADLPQIFRYVGQTPVTPGCYLRVSVRLKRIDGGPCRVRLAAWPADDNNDAVSGLTTTTSNTSLAPKHDVIEASMIIGTGARPNVDAVWPLNVAYAHLGFDIDAGSVGSVVRVDHLQIEDVTYLYSPATIPTVDVRDFGAVGDGVTDDTAAFLAADAAALGRRIYVPNGQYYIGETLELNARPIFAGQIIQPDDKRLILNGSFDFDDYIEAFGDEELALKKGLFALLNFSDFDTLDLKGRIIDITEPIDVEMVVANRDTLAVRRVIKNGSIRAVPGSVWSPRVAILTADYSTDSDVMTNVSDIAQLELGMLVEGPETGRETYVTAIDEATGVVTLSGKLLGDVTGGTFTFTRFRYLLDFSGFENLPRIILDNIEFDGRKIASHVMMPKIAHAWHFSDCWFVNPGHRCITAHDRGDQGMAIEGCEFLSGEGSVEPADRVTIAISGHGNDNKIRDNRIVQFRHSLVLSGSGHIISNNHWWQAIFGDATRTAGLVLTRKNAKATIDGNYCDNSWIELSNENSDEGDDNTAFGTIAITGNIFTVNGPPAGFRFIKLVPRDTNAKINGISILSNDFKSLNGSIERVDGIDETHGSIDTTNVKRLNFQSNNFNKIQTITASPITVAVKVTSQNATDKWLGVFENRLPFDLEAARVVSLVAEGKIRNVVNDRIDAMPYVLSRRGANGDRVEVRWLEPCYGEVHLTAACDLPE